MGRSLMMRAHGLFLLLYVMGLCWGTCSGFRNESCLTGGTCVAVGPAEGFLQCVGLHPSETGPQHLHRLRSIMEALMDLYTFMRASVRGVPVLSLEGALDLSLPPLHNKDLVKMWLEVKMKPLLHSVSKQMLSCLSAKNFSCETYQLMVTELSEYYSDMNPVRQKWIYDFFLYPFLARDGVRGCVEQDQNFVDWIMKNFGNFKAMARVKDFSTLYIGISGLEFLEALHLLTPAQKAELLLNPEVLGLDNGTLHVVFNSIMEHPGPTPTPGTRPTPSTGPGTGPTTGPGTGPTTGPGTGPTTGPGTGNNWTTPGYSYSTAPPQDPNALSIDHSVPTLKQVWDGFMSGFRPVSRLVHDFVTLTQEKEVSHIRITDLVQLGLNFTLEELAAGFNPAPEKPEDFDPTSVDDWYSHVVMPVLVRFLPRELLTQGHVYLAFQQLFFLDHGVNGTTEIQDVCSITVNQAQCGLTDVVEDVAHCLHCAAQNQLTLDEETVLKLLLGLTPRLSSLLWELSHTDLHYVIGDIKQIFSESSSVAVTEEHLSDPAFIQLWFRVKLLPLLPNVSPELLSCLSRKNFSCPVYQTIVRLLSQSMMEAEPRFQQRVYDFFIFPFLQNHNSPAARCSFSSSAVWIVQNFGLFSRFASIADFFRLNPDFDALEALPALTPRQIAELLTTNPELVPYVLDRLESQPDQITAVLEALVQRVESGELSAGCQTFTPLIVGLNELASSASAALEPQALAWIELVLTVAPPECVPPNVTCAITEVNESSICRNSSGPDSWSFSNVSMNNLCSFPLETFACAQLENFTAAQLASLLACDLPGNSSSSRRLWKLLLTKLSSILDPALDILAATPGQRVTSSASVVLDVLGEVRVAMFTGQELRNSSLVQLWFSRRLRSFLPQASGRFLLCLSSRNLSCSSYQLILQTLSQSFDNMTREQQENIVKNYIVRFLSRSISGPGCISTNNSVWLQLNLGPFSQLLPLSRILQLNPTLDVMEILPFLTPRQSAALFALPPPPSKEQLIYLLFDRFTQGPDREQFPDFLSYLPLFVPMGNLSCSDFRTLFNRLDLAKGSVSVETQSAIIRTKASLSRHLPYGCNIYEGQCTTTHINESGICAGVNSSAVQLLVDQGGMNGRFCDFSVRHLACASLTSLTAENLKEIMTCPRPLNASGSRASWKLLLSKVDSTLDQALDLLANTTLNSTQAGVILDAIREVRLDSFSQDQINHPLALQFFSKLRPFLSVLSMDFLHCLASRELNCSTFQHIVAVLSLEQPRMSRSMQTLIYTHFIRVYLSRNNTADPGCLSVTNSTEWAIRNLGAFLRVVPFSDLHILNPNLVFMEILPLLTTQQLVELCLSPEFVQTAAQANAVLSFVPTDDLELFLVEVSAAIDGHQTQFPRVVISTLLQFVFDRIRPSELPDSALVSVWLSVIRPLLVYLSPDHVSLFFAGVVRNRSCGVQMRALQDLDSSISTLNQSVQNDISDHITSTVLRADSLMCYQNDNFFVFLETIYQRFPFPSLQNILGSIPPGRRRQILNTISVIQLTDLLNDPHVTITDFGVCEVLLDYDNTPAVLEAGLAPHLRASSLSCVFRRTLTLTSEAEVQLWFQGIVRGGLLVFMNRELLTSIVTSNTTCVAFRGVVSVMATFNFTGSDLTGEIMFTNIIQYFQGSLSRCYNPSDPQMNSTAFFVQYFGVFFRFMTLERFQALGSVQFLQVFAVNLENIALVNNSALPQNVLFYYAELIYLQDINFSPILLPLICRCVAPPIPFLQLIPDESRAVLTNLASTCPNLSQQTAAALASTFGTSVDGPDIRALGAFSIWLSEVQLRATPASALQDTVGTLGGLSTWRIAQARAMVTVLGSAVSNRFTSSSLRTLRSLVRGLTTPVVRSISSTELRTAVLDPDFVQELQRGGRLLTEACVWQIIPGLTTSGDLLSVVPSPMMAEVPRVRVLSVPTDLSALQQINSAAWRPQQAELFFPQVAQVSVTAALNGTDGLSSLVLQGFSCTTVASLPRAQVLSLIKACGRTGTNRVQLVEPQLTCMFFYIRNESLVTDFSQLLPDLLLYYDYSVVPEASCRSYFQHCGQANFFIFSPDQSFRKTELFNNAKSCLGITDTRLTSDQIAVLGNMCCILDADYIQTSDRSILEQLETCQELSSDQANAVETLLESGNTQFGAPSSWNQTTLQNLGRLVASLNPSFYSNFDTETKQNFISYARQVLRGQLPRSQYRQLIRTILASIRSRSRRQTTCSVGIITAVQISEENFPVLYDEEQWDACLSPETCRDNLDAITDKVVASALLRVVLDKLNEVNPGSFPEEQVQSLGLASRQANSEDISRWTITELDTLDSLLNRSDGLWELSLAGEVIMKYLSVDGNTLGSAELNVITLYICALDVSTLNTITTDSIRDAQELEDLSNCNVAQNEVLFNKAREAFSSPGRNTVSVSTYQLIRAYLGGADSDYVKSLVNSNINMDLQTLLSLNPDVIQNLTVSDVQGLLGTHLDELKSYENNSLIQNWISIQDQDDLDALGIGLSGGRETVTTTAATSGATTTASGATTTAGGATTTASGATTTAGGATTTASGATTTAGGATTTAGGATTTAGGATTTASRATTTAGGATTTASGATTTAGGATTTASGATTTASGATTTAGGATTTIATASTTAAPGATTAAPGATTTTASSTTARGVSLSAPSGLFLFLLLLLSAYQHIFN